MVADITSKNNANNLFKTKPITYGLIIITIGAIVLERLMHGCYKQIPDIYFDPCPNIEAEE